MTFLANLLEAVRHAKQLTVLTGAGVSAESGIPTFRDRLSGLWERYEPAELATPEAFARDPALVWGWYESRRAALLRAQPNPAHRAIAQMATHVPRLTLVTQNVDDLHERAGSRDALHLHGEIARPYCERCRRVHMPGSGVPAMADGGQRLEPPRCSACGGRIRPGVVWFGESLPEDNWKAAVQAASQCDVLICVGTSAVVQPAASLISRAHAAGAVTIQVNPNPTEMDGVVSHALRGRAGEILPALVQSVWNPRSV
jgi:NAD-dependent deacetylase